MSLFVIEKGHPGFQISRDIPKLGYKGIKTCELIFQDFEVPLENLIGGEEGRGFKHVMSGLETGRINVAARGVGLARACLEASLRYAQERRTFGVPIAEHQLIQEKLADMATRLEAARMLTYAAAQAKDRGQRVDMEAGDGQALRDGARHGRCPRSHAHPRGLRLHPRVPDRALFPGRAALDHR